MYTFLREGVVSGPPPPFNSMYNVLQVFPLTNLLMSFNRSKCYRKEVVSRWTTGPIEFGSIPTETAKWFKCPPSDDLGYHHLTRHAVITECTDVKDDIILRIRRKTPKIDLPSDTNYRVTLITE